MKYIALPHHLEGFLFAIGLALLIVGCGSDQPETAEEKDTETPVMFQADLQVVVSSGRVRAEPHPQAQIVQQLSKNAGLKDLGEVSRTTTQMTFGSDKFDEPWLQVQDSSGQSGWIYAREVAPFDPQLSLQQFRREKQLLSLFGRAGYERLQLYQELYRLAKSETEVADAYLKGLQLRDTLTPMLENRSFSYSDSPLPDLFWLDEQVAGYVTQLVAEGTIYYLFNDYRQWLQLAQKSRGTQDDLFFTLMTRVFPQDSVEYFYPAWELQTWDYGGHHLLGRGVTYDILSRIEQLSPRTPLFSKPLLQLKDRILADLTRADIHFWEPDSLVKRELDAIIQANWSIFTATDRIALDTRRLQLDSAAYHGIGFNARSGE